MKPNAVTEWVRECPYTDALDHRCRRLREWHSRLCCAFDVAGARRFEYGRHDCLQFTAQCVEAVTGTNFASRFPAYRDEAGASALLKSHGGVEGILTACLGEPVSYEQRVRCLLPTSDLAKNPRDGDVILAHSKYGPTAGVVFFGACVFASSPDDAHGMWTTGPSCIRKAWRIA